MFGALGRFVHEIRIKITAVDLVKTGVRSAIANLERLRYAAIAITDASRRLMWAGAGIMAALIFPVKSAVEFNWAMTDIQKTTRLSIAEITGGLKGLVDKGIPETIEGFLKIAKIVGQAGVEGKRDIFAMTETLAKLDIVSDVTAEQAGESLVRFARLFKIPLAESERLGSALVHLANITTATEMNIVKAMQRAGKGFDVLRFDQVAGLSAALIDLSVPVFIVGTGIRNIFARMQTRADMAAKAFGVTKEAWAGMITRDPVGTLFAFAEKAKGLGELARTSLLTKLFGQREYLIMSKLMDNMDRIKEVMNQGAKAFRENTTLSEMLAIKMMSPMARLIVLWNHLRMLLIELGGTLATVLDTIVVRLTRMVKQTRLFIEQHPGLFRMLGIMLALTGAAMLTGGAFLRVVSSVLSLVVAIGMLKVMAVAMKLEVMAAAAATNKLAATMAFWKGTGASLTAVSGTAGTLAGSLGILAVAVVVTTVALGLMVWKLNDAYQHSERFRRSVQSLRDVLSMTFDPILYNLGRLVGGIKAALHNFTDAIGLTRPGIDDFNDAMAKLIGTGSSLHTVIMGLGSVIHAFSTLVIDPIIMKFAIWADTLSFIVNALRSIASFNWNVGKGDLGGAWESLKGLKEPTGTYFKNMVEDLGKPLRNLLSFGGPGASDIVPWTNPPGVPVNFARPFNLGPLPATMQYPGGAPGTVMAGPASIIKGGGKGDITVNIANIQIDAAGGELPEAFEGKLKKSLTKMFKDLAEEAGS